MWKINNAGYGYNPKTGETMFVNISVLKQDKGCGGHRHWMGTFVSVEAAQTFIEKKVAELNATEETDHVED